MSRQRIFAAPLLVASLAMAACGSGQDPALEVPDETATSSAAPEAPAVTSPPVATFADIALTGAAEVPGPGDDDGTGFATVFVEQDQLCYDINVLDIAPATAAHIHEGGVGESGPPVVTLEPPSAEGAVDGCVAADPDLLQRIAANPAGFYVNVHNDEFPEGALRGQLG
ncbi:MAG TPA: CHRD domain-containing protein [Acidimicrobiales bacterium]|nr:CHRD domain-containing protein [Acidimicrobiales bacterium]